MSKKSKTNAIQFELLAPYNDSVGLMGSWNKWQVIPMERDEQGIISWDAG